MIPETVTPEGLRQRAEIMRGILDESCARHLELAANEIERLRTFEFAQKANEWQPIETAPKDGTRILLFQSGRGAFEGWWHTDWPHAEAYWMDDADSEPFPSHWQPCLAFPTVSETSCSAGEANG